MSNAGAGPAGAGAGGPAQLTPEEIEELTNLLTDMARADGLHDFGSGFGPVTSAKNADVNYAFKTSVPGSPGDYEWNEPTALTEAFFQLSQARFKDVLVGALRSPVQPTGIEIRNGASVDGLFGTKTGGFPYQVRAIPFNAAGSLEGKALAEAVFGPDPKIILQVDFNHHGFLTKLRGPGLTSGETAIEIGYMWTAATVNDPASKTDPSEAVFLPGNQVYIKPYRQRPNEGTTVFGTGRYDPADMTKNFMSNYDVELSGIQVKGIFGKKQKSSVSIKFQQGAQSAVISDSKGQNSKDQLEPFIGKLIEKLRQYATNRSATAARKLQFELATKWMQKRSGDWLQALHAKMFEALPFDSTIEPGTTPFFVSHDQIAIAYALSMGLSCLYFMTYPAAGTPGAVDYIVVFDNRQKDPATQARQAAERETYCDTELNKKGDIDSKWKWYTKLLATRTTSLQERSNSMEANIRLMNSYIERPVDPDRVYSVGGLERYIKQILGAAMDYVYLETAIPDDIVNPNTGLRFGQFSFAEGGVQPSACAKYNAYEAITRLQSTHGEDANYSDQLPEHFYDRFHKSKAYKTLVQWDIEGAVNNDVTPPVRTKPELEGDNGRIADPPNGQNPPHDGRDRFLFLAFIANSRNSEHKDRIATVFKSFQDDFLANGEVNLDAIGARSASRKNRVEAGLRNILTQGYIHLKTRGIPAGDWPSVRQDIRMAMDVPTRSDDSADVVEPITFFGRIKLFASLLLRAFIPDRTGPGHAEAQIQESEDPERDVAPTQSGGGQQGGWTSSAKPVDRRDLDTRQTTDPDMHAIVEVGVDRLLGILEDTSGWRRVDVVQPAGAGAGTTLGSGSSDVVMSGGGRGDTLASKGWKQQKEGVWRDPLTLLDYNEETATNFQRARDVQKGGASSSEDVRNVLELLLAMTASQIRTDTEDMEEAVISQREYYTRGVDLLDTIQQQDATPELALATYDLACCSRFIPTAVFQAHLGIENRYEAEAVRLFFSGLESYSLIERPAFAGNFIEMLKPVYDVIKSNPIKSTAEIRATAEGILTAVLKKNGIQYPPLPVEKGVVKTDLTAGPSGEEPTDVLNTSLTRGQTQDPGALEKSFSTPERPSRQSGGKRRPLFTTP